MNHKMLWAVVGGLAAGWIVNNLVQGATAFDIPSSGQWFSTTTAT